MNSRKLILILLPQNIVNEMLQHDLEVVDAPGHGILWDVVIGVVDVHGGHGADAAHEAVLVLVFLKGQLSYQGRLVVHGGGHQGVLVVLRGEKGKVKFWVGGVGSYSLFCKVNFFIPYSLLTIKILIKIEIFLPSFH